MAVATPTQTDLGLKALGVGTNITATWTSVGLTTGRGLLLLLEWGDATSVITVSGVSLATDGALSAATSAHVRNNDARGQWWYLPNVSTATQNLTVTYTGSANSGSMEAVAFEITGHDTGSMIGGSQTGTDVNTFDLTTQAANSAVFVALQVSSADSANVTSSGMTFTKYDHTNSASAGAASYALDTGAAGSKTINWSAYGYWALGVEVKAVGGSTAKPHYYYAQL